MTAYILYICSNLEITISKLWSQYALTQRNARNFHSCFFFVVVVVFFVLISLLGIIEYNIAYFKYS